MKHQQKHQQGQRNVPNAIHVQKFLGGLDYPVDKRELIEKAKKNGADESVLQALQNIPEREYESPVSVSREVTHSDSSSKSKAKSHH